MENGIRTVDIDDSADILRIYSHYIISTAYTFEVDVPTISQFTKRVAEISKDYPFLVYVQDGKTVGYAYASKHRERDAYCYDVDVAVYMDVECRGAGIGTKLYNMLFEMLKKQGFYNAYAGITVPNERSVELHKKYGFEDIGVFKKTGYKFGKWHGVQWMGKALQDYGAQPKKILPVEKIKL